MPHAVTFIHAPKCGGTSVGSALRARYFFSQATINLHESAVITAMLYPDAAGVARVRREFDIRDAMMAQLVRRKVQCISAHSRYHPGIRELDPLPRHYITILREPVERFVSHYLYLQRRHPESVQGASVDEFLDSEQAQRLGSEYLFYFSRNHQVGEHDTTALIETACNALSTFDEVGDTSEMGAFRARVERVLGVRLLRLNRNRRPSGTEPGFSAAQLSRVRDICQPDLEIYEFARTMRIGSKLS